METKRIGEEIRKLREEKGLSASELARRAGVAPSTVTRTESGGTPHMENLARIARALGVDVRDLV